MDEFRLELSELDETQERVEAVANEMLKAQEVGDVERIEAMVEEWIDTLRTGGFQVERMAFLYVANHVLQKTLHTKHPPHFVNLFQCHLEEAVSLVSNSPMDRQNVQRLLELWQTTAVFPDHIVLKLWQCTGEEIPSFLAKVAGDDSTTQPIENASVPQGSMDPDTFLQSLETELNSVPAPALPKLTGHAANPVLNVLKKIDHHKAALQYIAKALDQKQHEFVLIKAPTRYTTPEDILTDSTVSVSTVKQRVETCFRLIKLRNQLMDQIPLLKKELQTTVATMLHLEEEALGKNEARLEQCDLIDIGLADLAEHRELYPTEWMNEADACQERRRLQEEAQREREEEIARLHHSALAESAAHAMSLEADTEGSPSALTSLAAQYKTRGEATKEREQKAGEAPTNEMVWHPVLKELVPLQSLNVEWEDWRDH